MRPVQVIVPVALAPLSPVAEPHSVAPERFELVVRKARTVETLTLSVAVYDTETEEPETGDVLIDPEDDGAVVSLTLNVAAADVDDDEAPSMFDQTMTRYRSPLSAAIVVAGVVYDELVAPEIAFQVDVAVDSAFSH